MDNRIVFLDTGAKKVVGDCNQISEKPTMSISQASENIPPQAVGHHCCPDCQIKLVCLGSCFLCPLCGYGGCG